MRYFVIQRSFDLSDTFAVMADPPRLDTKEQRAAFLVVELNELGQSLSLDELTFLYRAGDLQGTTYRRRVKLSAKSDGAKAFAKYRELREIKPYPHPYPTERDRAKERRRVIRRALRRRLAVASIGQFCVLFGRMIDSYKLEE